MFFVGSYHFWTRLGFDVPDPNSFGGQLAGVVGAMGVIPFPNR